MFLTLNFPLLSTQLLGFFSLAVCLIDVFLGLQSIHGLDQESKEFASELLKSKSAISSMHSDSGTSVGKSTSGVNSQLALFPDQSQNT